MNEQHDASTCQVVASFEEVMIGLRPRDTHSLPYREDCASTDWRCVHHLFEAQVRTAADATAAVVQKRTFTYGWLNRRANQLAAYLATLGAGHEVPVCLCLDRSEDMLVALLAVLKVGSCYIPVDPALPADRIQWMLEDSQAPLVLTQSWFAADLPRGSRQMICLDAIEREVFGAAADDFCCEIDPEQLAYIIYTSGSTGRPKGVEVRHSAVVKFLDAMQVLPGLTANDIVLASTTLSFDISVLEIFLPLSVGARVVVIGRDVATDGRQLSRAIQEHGITFMQATPATWRLLLTAGWKGRRSLKILCGGEALSAPLAEQLLKRCSELWNMYGPTETTVWSTLHQVRCRAETIAIGHPIRQTEVYVLDQHYERVADGQTGELYIGGAGLARGYRNRPDLTAERFIPNPFDGQRGARLYRTGDLARTLPDGSLECLGRTDHQVKVRGYRIELGEIERVLVSHQDVREAIVAAGADSSGETGLVAYFVSSSSRLPRIDDLREHLRRLLPDYMIPRGFVALPALPRLPNGKVNRGLLPSSQQCQHSPEVAAASPRNANEQRLTEIFERILAIHPIGIHDNVLDLGIHSLTAASLFAEIERTFGSRLPPSPLFQAPTIEQLGRLLEEGHRSATSLVPIQPRGAKSRLFCVHGGAGHILMFQALAERLGTDQPVYGLQARGINGNGRPLTSVEDLAIHYVNEIQSLQPSGPYWLGGYCFGGLVAYEMARLLRRQGHEVPAIILFNAPSPKYIREHGHEAGEQTAPAIEARGEAHLPARPRIQPSFATRLADALAWRSQAAWKRMQRAYFRQCLKLNLLPPRKWREQFFRMIHDRAELIYDPPPSDERLIIFQTPGLYSDPYLGWGDIVSRPIDILEIPSWPRHRSALLKYPSVRLVGKHLNDCLSR